MEHFLRTKKLWERGIITPKEVFSEYKKAQLYNFDGSINYTLLKAWSDLLNSHASLKDLL